MYVKCMRLLQQVESYLLISHSLKCFYFYTLPKRILFHWKKTFCQVSETLNVNLNAVWCSLSSSSSGKCLEGVAVDSHPLLISFFMLHTDLDYTTSTKYSYHSRWDARKKFSAHGFVNEHSMFPQIWREKMCIWKSFWGGGGKEEKINSTSHIEDTTNQSCFNPESIVRFYLSIPNGLGLNAMECTDMYTNSASLHEFHFIFFSFLSISPSHPFEVIWFFNPSSEWKCFFSHFHPSISCFLFIFQGKKKHRRKDL